MVDLKKSIKKCFHVSVTFIFSLKNVLEEMTKKKNANFIPVHTVLTSYVLTLKCS